MCVTASLHSSLHKKTPHDGLWRCTKRKRRSKGPNNSNSTSNSNSTNQH